jgi:hypothetical protein
MLSFAYASRPRLPDKVLWARSAAIGRACRKEHLQRFTAAQSVKGDRSRLAETPAPHADSDTPYAIAF